MIPGSANPLLLKSAAAAGGYQIERSLRFNSSDSAYLSRTPASAGNRRTWTWAGWVKRSVLGTRQQLFSAPSNSTYIEWQNDALQIEEYSGSPVFKLALTAVQRDTSAWYHILVAFDTTQATPSNRIKIYINGVEQAAFSTASYPSPNHDSGINGAALHKIGAFPGSGDGGNFYYLNGYLADIHFIDGQALTPSSFTEVSATTGQLIPKAYTGTFTGNSFWLKFADNSAATATTLGKDSSGLGNNWTPNNLSVTAGAGNDSLVDTPTSYGTGNSGGDVRGNFCTWNPLQSSAATLTNGNLDCTTAVATGAQTRGTIAVSTGKWYWEILVNTTVSANNIGIIKTSEALAADRPSYYAGGYCYVGSSGNKENNASASSYGATYGSGDVIGVALDLDAGTLVFYKNGTSQGTAFSSLSGEFIPAIGDGTGGSGMDISANFGQRAFAYPVSGFKALVDTNLTAPVIAKPNTVMDVALWTGNGGTQTVSYANSSFSPDFIWFKSRSIAMNNHVVDVVRGTDANGYLVMQTDATFGESVFDTSWHNTYGKLTSISNNSFTVVSGTSNGGFNTNNVTYAGWAWDAGTTTSSNVAGSISSGAQVRANPSSGFSVVTWVGDGTGTTRTVGHGLGVAPSLIIAKNRTSADGWPVYHKELGNSQIVYLNTTAAASTNTAVWNSTSPTSTVFSIGGTGLVNELNYNYVAYCFAPVAGYSSFGSYTGNGSADGPFVYTGFRPRWLLIKNTTGSNNWELYDAARDPNNVVGKVLLPNTSDAEITNAGATPGVRYDFLSNGFKLRDSQGSVNGSGNTIIFAAFAESPFQYARAR